ncbi:exodeoxyribonuclease III [Notoacmeibacter sp. MSK16QG-6]|uniref:exodeoxyribonuclease III n=1 Tax=Notoacmeibacter sp. MSK16QG-6 TaxID=2957982 RepID=UPI00209E0856|nr:exodeoxyribonuclease III [Notoacmeibacter sp. MSK16QG-6]MCP1199397.1 exodeoxyribonuclease III [Notoacmeibacter sp. MSK16QG-6]
MKIATFNINGIKARSEVLLAWLEESQPDIVGLQEIKSQDETFPRAALEEKGWHVETHGQKGFNGVALISRMPPSEVNRGLPGDENGEADAQARFIEGVWETKSGPLRVVSLYLPNGNPVGEDRKWGYKLRWMERLQRWAEERLFLEEMLVLAGDYNVIPEPRDARHPENWVDDALFQPESRAAFRRLLGLGFTDAIRACDQSDGLFTFWDYQAGAWPKNNGIRIDHLLLSPEAADRLLSTDIEKHVRGWEKPSDHVPTIVNLSIK